MLEDDPNFNAGRGAVFTYDGDDRAGRVDHGRAHARAPARSPASRTTKNPISLARAVMEKSDARLPQPARAPTHSRKEQGLEQAPPSYFATAERRRQLEELKTKKVSALDDRI